MILVEGMGLCRGFWDVPNGLVWIWGAFAFAAMPLGSTVDVFATEDPNVTEAAERELQVYEKKDNILHGHRKKR